MYFIFKLFAIVHIPQLVLCGTSIRGSVAWCCVHFESDSLLQHQVAMATGGDMGS